MPKKHRSSFFTKPQSTAHSSLSSTKNNDLSKQDATPSSVNDILSNLRKTGRNQNDKSSTPVAQPPTMPPSVRQLLQVPEVLPPRPRIPRRIDAFGYRLPAGPEPPRSWLRSSRSAPRPTNTRVGERKYPDHVLHLPGATMPSGLMHLCLQNLARDWEFQSSYNTYYLATMPTRLRILLLSYIAVSGPEEGVGSDALSLIIRPPPDEAAESDFSGNENFHRLDVSGSIGRSISFSQLTGIVVPSEGEADSEEWNDDSASTIPRNPTTFLPFLTHLSLSHPPPNISWAKFIQFAKKVPTITHLSLAYWPEPSLTPNSKTATIDPRHGLSVQYGGTNYYSHSLDDDWSEAAGVLRRLSWALYNLEWLNLDGCTDWAPALKWRKSGINWKDQWGKVRTISLKSLHGSRIVELLAEESDVVQRAGQEVKFYKEAILKAVEVETHIRRQRGWIAVEHDEWEKYDYLLTEPTQIWDEKLKLARFSEVDGTSDAVGTISAHDFWG